MESITGNDQGKQAEQATGSIIHIGHLLDYLRRVKDGRKRRGIRYPLEVILALFILAKLCGENKVYGIADWVQLRSEYLIQALDLKLKRNCLPHHSTYRRILTMKSVPMIWKSFSASIWHNFPGEVRRWSL
jgi:hypothetical protein